MARCVQLDGVQYFESPAQIDFAANRDPLTGHPAEAAFQPLFQKILRSAPAPIGLG